MNFSDPTIATVKFFVFFSRNLHVASFPFDDQGAQ